MCNMTSCISSIKDGFSNRSFYIIVLHDTCPRDAGFIMVIDVEDVAGTCAGIYEFDYPQPYFPVNTETTQSLATGRHK